jgi:cation diffusion facilitator CzcD-associated flavoprotein CzcO
VQVIVIGAGFGGIAAAIELTRNGYDDVTLLDAADEPGGTWHYNTYPGAACDVPSAFYCFSYAQRPDWTRICSPQAEILEYLHDTAVRFDVARRVVTGVHVSACRWDDSTRRWTVVADDGTERTCDALVVATGQLNQPADPRLEGLDDFAGHAFHSARWDHEYDLRGKRVAVIGTGASAVQFVPEIAPLVERLDIYQRTGNWFMPRHNSHLPSALRALFRLAPPLYKAWRFGWYLYMEVLTAMIRHPRTLGWTGRLKATWFMRKQLRDPEVRAKAWPDYVFGCKRVLFSSKFLPALQRPNVELITDPITRMTPAGPETDDGTVREVDCVIYATGFRTNDFMFPMAITGAGGRSLREAWADGARAHLGITVPGFPSLFLMYGPNTNTSGGSIVYFLEAQARYLRRALDRVQAAGAAAIDVRRDVELASDNAVQSAFAGTAWTQCNSWYRDGTGRVVANWPRYMRSYSNSTAALNPDDYDLIEPAPQTSA